MNRKLLIYVFKRMKGKRIGKEPIKKPNLYKSIGYFKFMVSNIILGPVLVVLGGLMMKFSYFCSNMIFSRQGPNNFKDYFHKKQGPKMVFYFGAVLLLFGLYFILINVFFMG